MGIKQETRLLELGVSNANPNFRDMSLAITALAQEQARSRMAAAAPVAITDNSAGTADTTPFSLLTVAIAAVVTMNGALTVGNKAHFDLDIGLIEDAHEELGSKVNEMLVLIAGPNARSIGAIAAAAAADDTILVIEPVGAQGTPDVGSETAANAVAAVSGNAQLVHARNMQGSLAAAINYVRIALGLNSLEDNTGGVHALTTSAWTMADAAATATAAITTEDSLDLTEVNASLQALVDNIATMSAVLNEMRGTLAIGPFVVATSSAAARFKDADVTV